MAPDRPGSEEDGGVSLTQNNGVTVPITLLSIPNSILQIKEGDGASEERSGSEKGNSEDDDLTSLSWLLQDKNLLKGINLRTPVAGAQESPTSDFVDDSASEPGESTCSSVNSSSPVPTTIPAAGKNKHPHHIPYDPQIHVTSKPPYSFSCLIFMSIEDSPVKALPVKEIYAWILDHFPYYKNAPTGWKNSVRHNLSLNKCFRKVEKAPNLGKGSLWMVDPMYRPNLVQALKKAPYHPYTNAERPITARVHPQPASLTDQQESSLRIPNKTPATGTTATGGRLPDPELFPYLSRRLAASGLESTPVDTDDSLDDVDAAAAMLALKHGPNIRISISQRRDEYHKQLSAINLCAGKGKKKIKEEVGGVLITSCPSEDHTYSVEPIQRVDVKIEPSSPDEAFQEGSDSNSSWVMRLKVESEAGDVEEQRKIAEGADALLNLAGITTNSNHHINGNKRSKNGFMPTKKLRTNEEPNEPFRPRLLRKSPLKRDNDDKECDKKCWKPGMITENNNIIETSSSSVSVTTNKMRRKPLLTSAKNLGKIKR
ncbi:forkhead box protein N3-like [Lycorma delicatula]|uniref:forkhead box protein N3-like n=1 Tax=Lycorma delicatula TaxID=130591 RepID=UPI003F514E4C